MKKKKPGKITINLTESSKLFLQQLQDSLDGGKMFGDVLEQHMKDVQKGMGLPHSFCHSPEEAFIAHLSQVLQRYGKTANCPKTDLQAKLFVGLRYANRIGRAPNDKTMQFMADNLLRGDVICLRPPQSTKP